MEIYFGEIYKSFAPNLSEGNQEVVVQRRDAATRGAKFSSGGMDAISKTDFCSK